MGSTVEEPEMSTKPSTSCARALPARLVDEDGGADDGGAEALGVAHGRNDSLLVAWVLSRPRPLFLRVYGRGPS